MARKVNAQRLEARKLFEQDGLSLTEIAKLLGISPGTVRGWKSKDKRNGAEWNAPENSKRSKRSKKRERSERSEKKTKEKSTGEDWKFKPGNKAALKHGLYSDYSNDPKFKEAFNDSLDKDMIDVLREQIAQMRANLIVAQNEITGSGAASFNALSKLVGTLTNAIDRYENLKLLDERRKQIQLDNQKKELELERDRAALEGNSLLNYPGLPIDAIAPVFAGLHYDIRNKRYREFVLPGGRGSTKSSFISLEIINLIEKNPKFHALVCRQVDKDLRDTVFNQLQWAIDLLGLNSDYKVTYKPLEITKKSTGQKIYFTGLKDPTSVKSFTPTFGYVALLWFEELDQILGNETVRKVEQSIVRGGDSFYIFKSFNPPRSKNNWANVYIQQPKESMKVYPSTYLDVPEEWLGKPFIEEAKFLKEHNPEAYKNEYLGEANGSGGNVFPNLVVREITDEEISHFDNIVNGLDFGWVHPSFFVRCQNNIAQQQILLFDEICESYLPNKKLAEKIKEHGIGPKDRIICDSAEPKSISELRENGLNAVGAIKGPNSVGYGVKYLASQIELVVDPVRCPKAYKQLIEYEYIRDKAGNVTSLLPAIDDDAVAALRYANEPFMGGKRRSGAYAMK